MRVCFELEQADVITNGAELVVAVDDWHKIALVPDTLIIVLGSCTPSYVTERVHVLYFVRAIRVVRD